MNIIICLRNILIALYFTKYKGTNELLDLQLASLDRMKQLILIIYAGVFANLLSFNDNQEYRRLGKTD